MNVQVNKDGAVLEVAVSGRLDTATAPQLDSTLKQEITDGISALNMDLAGLDYISSAGLRVLLAAQKQMNTAGGSMRVLHPNEVVAEIFDVTGFDEILTIES